MCYVFISGAWFGSNFNWPDEGGWKCRETRAVHRARSWVVVLRIKSTNTMGITFVQTEDESIAIFCCEASTSSCTNKFRINEFRASCVAMPQDHLHKRNAIFVFFFSFGLRYRLTDYHPLNNISSIKFIRSLPYLKSKPVRGPGLAESERPTC